jgi:hypothetical protein
VLQSVPPRLAPYVNDDNNKINTISNCVCSTAWSHNNQPFILEIFQEWISIFWFLTKKNGASHSEIRTKEGEIDSLWEIAMKKGKDSL